MSEPIKTTVVLKSVSSKVKENVNGTLFRSCVVTLDGVDYLAKIWETSFQNGVTLGNDYQCEIQQDGEDVWLTVLTGGSAKIATLADVAHLFAKIPA
jgi:hypothetical protein